MDIEKRIDILEKTLNRQLEWVRAADVKIAPMLVIATSMLGVAAARLADINVLSSYLSALMAVSSGLLLSVVVSMVFAAFPRVKRQDSLVFFEGIRTLSPAEYRQHLLTVSPDQYLDDLIKACHTNAQIASVKFHHIRNGMILLFLSILPWVALMYGIHRQS